MQNEREFDYCPICSSCDDSSVEYAYYKEMTEELYEEFPDKDKLKEIFERVWNKHFNNEQ